MLTWEIFTDEGNEGTVARSSILEAGSNGDADPCHYEVWQFLEGEFRAELYGTDHCHIAFPPRKNLLQAIADAQAHYAEQTA